VGTVAGNLTRPAGGVQYCRASRKLLKTQNGETKVNSRHRVNPRKMAKMAPTAPLSKKGKRREPASISIFSLSLLPGHDDVGCSSFLPSYQNPRVLKPLKLRAKLIFPPLSSFSQVFGHSDDKTNTKGNWF
jgi:hypothetical protein